MPTRKVRPVDDVIDISGIEIPTALLTTLEGGEPSRKGITVINERCTSLLMHKDADGKDIPVEYTVAIFISRQPIDSQEKAAIDVYVAGVDGRRTDKEAKEAKHLASEKREMFNLGQQAGAAVFDKLGAIAPALEAIEKLGMNLRAK